MADHTRVASDETARKRSVATAGVMAVIDDMKESPAHNLNNATAVEALVDALAEAITGCWHPEAWAEIDAMARRRLTERLKDHGAGR